MLYSVAALLAVASSALAQTTGYHALVRPNSGEVIPAGETFTLQWTVGTVQPAGPVDLLLYVGESHATLQNPTAIGSAIAADALKYEWAVPATLDPSKAYGIQIALAADHTVFQWSNPFTIGGGSGATNATSTSTSSSSSSSATTLSSSTTKATSSKPTVTPTGNFTTPAPTRTPTSTGTGSGSGNNGSPSNSAPVSVPTAAANTLSFGSLAVLGGVAVAILGM